MERLRRKGLFHHTLLACPARRTNGQLTDHLEAGRAAAAIKTALLRRGLPGQGAAQSRAPSGRPPPRAGSLRGGGAAARGSGGAFLGGAGPVYGVVVA